MNFAWPHLLWLLFVPLAWLVWELTHRRRAIAQARPKILRAEAGPKSLQLSTFNPQLSTTRSARRPRAWLCAGLALAVLALARPQYGRIEEPVFDQAREILLAVDLSRSMLAPDVMPSRLARAKLLIQSLLEKLAGERVGLVVFSGTAFLQSPLSADYEILREFLPALGPDFLPEGGSNYGALLDASLQAFSAAGAADRFLIILSDGEATDEDWKSKIDDLKKKSIRVIGLGIGTAGGAMIPDGTGQFVKDERGAVVMSKLESGTLQELAKATGGVYRDASAWVDLAALVSETIETGRKGKFVETNTVRFVERFQWPLALGLWCLLVSFCYEFPVRPRVRDIALRTMPEVKGQKSEVSKAAAAALLFLLSPFFLFPSRARAADAPATPPPSATLAKVVGRLSGSAAPSARDWADLGRETVAWGGRLQTEQQTVPEGPVRDALTAATLGAKLDPKVTDWPKLREELEALLKKPDDDKKDQDKNEQDNQDQQQQDKDQKKQDQKSDQQKKQKQDQKNQPQSSPDKNDPSQPQDQPENQKNQPPEQKEPGESAFGDMDKKDQPPPPPPSTQKVGGTPDRREEVRNPPDAALAQPLQKLEQLRSQDSPAQLFQLMEGPRKPSDKKSGKNW